MYTPIKRVQSKPHSLSAPSNQVQDWVCGLPIRLWFQFPGSCKPRPVAHGSGPYAGMPCDLSCLRKNNVNQLWPAPLHFIITWKVVGMQGTPKYSAYDFYSDYNRLFQYLYWEISTVVFVISETWICSRLLWDVVLWRWSTLHHQWLTR